METEDETSSNPTAMSSGFRSGRARETIFQSDEADLGDFLKIENDLKDQPDCFGEVAEDVEYDRAKDCVLRANGLDLIPHGSKGEWCGQGVERERVACLKTEHV